MGEHGHPTPSETSPLLVHHDPAPDIHIPHHNEHLHHDLASSRRGSEVPREHWYRWKALYLCAIISFMINFAAILEILSRFRRLSQGLCREHYLIVDPGVIRDDGSIPGELCTNLPILQSAASIIYVWNFLEVIFGLALPIPYGILADRLGRRVVIGLGLVGCISANLWNFATFVFYDLFSTAAVVVTPSFTLLGGGWLTISSLLLSIVAAEVPSKLRTRAFFWLQAASMVAVYAVSSIQNTLQPYLGDRLTFAFPALLQALAFIPLYFIPIQSTFGEDNSPETQLESGTTISSGFITNETDGPLRRVYRRLSCYIHQDITPTLSQTGFLAGTSALILAASLSTLLYRLIVFKGLAEFPIRDITQFFTIQAGIRVVLCIFVLQLVDWVLQKKQGPFSAALTIARGSIFMLVLGSLCLAAPQASSFFLFSTLVYGAGGGFYGAIQSALSMLVRKDQFSLFFSTLFVFSRLVGEITTLIEPLLNSTEALPFLILACLFALTELLIRPLGAHEQGDGN